MIYNDEVKNRKIKEAIMTHMSHDFSNNPAVYEAYILGLINGISATYDTQMMTKIENLLNDLESLQLTQVSKW